MSKKYLKEVITAPDYHDFSEIVFILNKYGNYKEKVKFVEFGYTELNEYGNSGYMGIIYTGKRPTKLIKKIKHKS